jgi:hypothetical protein
MKPFALDLDHCGTIVRDLDAAHAAFSKLGFKLTARSHHVGARNPGDTIAPLGSANHCAMLPQGYLEVMGHVDPTKWSSALAMLEKYEGLHIVAFRPESTEAIQQGLIAQGKAVEAPRALERMAPYGPDGSEKRRVAFHNMRFSANVFMGHFQFTDHLTRETMWQPHLLEHPNGAQALQKLYLCSPEPGVYARAFGPVLGVEPKVAPGGELVFEFAGSSLCILTPEAWLEMSPQASIPALPAPVGFAVRVKSLAALQALLKKNGVATQTSPKGGLHVYTCGTVIQFLE